MQSQNIFELILISKFTSVSAFDKHQFGCRAGHSAGHYAVKKVVDWYAVDYYTDHGSFILACFVNFSIAFDKVDYWKPFDKL